MGQQADAAGHKLRAMTRRQPPLCAGVLVLAGALVPALSVSAQTAANQPTPVLPPAYVDREIEGLAPELPLDAGATAYDPKGLPRFLRLETRLGTRPFDPQRETRIGYGVYGFLETPSHGTLSVDGRVAPSDRNGTLTLRQRGLPLHGGWMVGTELGVISPPAPEVLRLPARLYLPTSLLQGLSTEWKNAARGLHLQASTGEPGLLDFQPSSGFRRLPGQRTALGGQWHLNGYDAGSLPRQGWTLALHHEEARDVGTVVTPLLASELVDARSTVIAVRHEGAEHRVQGQVLRTEGSNISGVRSGVWIDSEWDDGPRRLGAGAYRLDPGLSWANLPLAADLVGAYTRASWRTRQWSAEGSLDWLDSISGRSGSGFFATASTRWRLQRGETLGIGTTVRRFDGDAWTSYADWRFQNGWGFSGLRLDLTHGERQARATRLSWDQEWRVQQGWALSSTLAGDASDAYGSQPAEKILSAALSMAMPLSDRVTVRGTLNSERSNVAPARHGLNLGANWRINPRWSLEAQYNRITGRSRLTPSLDPLAPPPTVLAPASDRSFFAVLRFEIEAGTRPVPLGGRPAEGGGRIEGVVYFDTNRSGAQDANEAGTPHIAVYLDNRYVARTDEQGRFDFPFVGAGPRTITVRNETLPLPWAVLDDGQVQVDVRLRETTRISIPVQRSD